MATLYVRNLPAELYEELRLWAEQRGRSVNAEVIEILRGESDRRRQQADFAHWLADYRAKHGGRPIDTDVVAMIREDRDRGHKPDFGY